MSQIRSSFERSANIFINYRRDDSAGHTGRLFDRLSARLPGRVFMDIDTLEPGVDFAEVIEKAVGSCQVLIVVIGSEWLRVEDAAGRRRLDDEADYVRLELATALRRSIRVIPVLVQGAPMPRAEELPADIAKLARRNAIELSDARWAYDVDRLSHTIEEVLRGLDTRASAPAPAPGRKAAPAAAAVTAAIAARPRAWMAVLAAVAACGLASAGWVVKQQAARPVVVPAATAPAPARPPHAMPMPAAPAATASAPAAHSAPAPAVPAPAARAAAVPAPAAPVPAAPVPAARVPAAPVPAAPVPAAPVPAAPIPAVPVPAAPAPDAATAAPGGQAKSAKSYETLGMKYLQEGRYDEAVTALTSAIDLRRKTPGGDPLDALYARSIAYNRSGRAADAISDLESLVKARDDLRYREELAIAYAHVGKREAAIGQYRSLLQSQPDNAWFNFKIGLLYIKERDYRKAAQAFDQALANRKQLTGTTLADAYDGLGIADFYLCWREEAVAAFKKAAELNPEYAPYVANAERLTCQRQ